MKIKGVRGIEYDLIDALRRAKFTITAGDCITDAAADCIEELEAALRYLVSECDEDMDDDYNPHYAPLAQARAALEGFE